MSLYVYGITSADSVHTGNNLAGVMQSRVRKESVTGLDVIVSDWTSGALAIDRESIQAHSRVLDYVLSQTTPLPFRFGVIVKESELAEFIKNNAQALHENLKQVEGCVQMSVKILIPSEFPVENNPKDSSGPGLQFLRGKHQKNLAAKQAADWLKTAAGPHIRSNATEVESDYHLLVRISHLVFREQIEEYRERMREAFDSRPDVRGIRSGPWPPYSFVSENVRQTWIPAGK